MVKAIYLSTNTQIMATAEQYTLLVHGGGLDPIPDGWVLGPGSVARVERAVVLLQEDDTRQVVFTGGNGHGHDLPVSEARLMADMAVRHGVAHGRIECEDQSSSTIGNWANSLPLLEDMGAETVVGVTSQAARTRARMIGSQLCQHYGVAVHLAGYVSSGEAATWKAYAREAVAVPLAVAWLANAWRKGRSLAELDEAYRSRRSNTPIGAAKALTGRRR